MGHTAMQKLMLLNAGSATSDPAVWRGGKAQFAVNGAFSGASVRLQEIGPDGANYVDVVGTQTAAYLTVVDLPPCQVRALVAGTATGTSLYCTLVGVPD